MKSHILLAMLFAISPLAYAKCIDIFYLPTCPHCEQALGFFYNISQEYNLTINEYNVENPNASRIFSSLSDYYNSSGGVPLIFIGNEAFLGFAYGNMSQQLNNMISIGYSAQLLKALQNAGNVCPVLPNNISCRNCYTTVLPNEAKKLNESDFFTNMFEIIVVFVLVIVAIFLAIKIGRRK